MTHPHQVHADEVAAIEKRHEAKETTYAAVTQCYNDRATLLRLLKSRPNEVAPNTNGTFSCPICGRASPHHHTEEEIAEHRVKERQRVIMENDYPILAEFFRKYALGSKMPPSCLACGKVEPFSIKHAELPDIGICETCALKSHQPLVLSDLMQEMAEHLKGNWVRRKSDDGWITIKVGCNYCDAPLAASVNEEVKHTSDCVLKKLDRLAPPATRGDEPETVAIGSVRLQRIIDGEFERVTVSVEINGEWIEVIREPYDNYFDHFVSPSGMRTARAMKRGGEHGSAMP